MKKYILFIVLSMVGALFAQHVKTYQGINTQGPPYYNGECGAIDIDNLTNGDEVIELLRPLVKKNGGNDI